MRLAYEWYNLKKRSRRNIVENTAIFMQYDPMSDKEIALESIQRLPETASFEVNRIFHRG